ncbi:MAG TPA: DUF4214 domain-containing protein [Pirellulales bacterium]|nr:DUF4214 domain-containing protein [Pirellulales bacterium]
MSPGVGYVAGQPGDHTNQTFVINLYRELLGREPDPQGETFWMNLLGANGANTNMRAVVIRGFLNSPEYAQHYVTTVYETFLGRAPDAAGLQFQVGLLESRHDLTIALIDIAGSQEYFLRNGGTNQSFVDALYRDLFGRPADAAAASWVSYLNGAGAGQRHPVTRDDVVRGMLFSSEGLQKLFNGNFESLTGSTPNASAGDSQHGAYALANVTGNGFANLFFQGNLNQAAINYIVAQLQKSGGRNPNVTDVLANLLAGDQFYG